MTKNNSTFELNYAVAPGEYIEEHMEYYGYSLQKFADICNCSVKSVKEIVIDKKPLTLELAKKIEKELDFPVDLLMSIEEDYRSRIKPVVKLKTREKKTPVVKQSYAVAQ